MGCIKLAITETNANEQGMRVYRDTSTIDTNNLPTIFASLPPNATGFDDNTVVVGETYHYVVSSFRGSSEVFSTEVSLTVPADNIAPVLAVPNAYGQEGTPFTVTATATDADGDTPLIFSLSAEPSGMTIGSTSGVIDWSTPIEAVYNFDVTVTDPGGAFDTVSYTLVVGNNTFSEVTNLAGVYSAGAGVTFVPPYNLAGTFSFA